LTTSTRHTRPLPSFPTRRSSDLGDSSVCAVGSESLKVGPCVKLESMPDGLAYVAATKEVWVTTPRDKSITILDASKAGALTKKRSEEHTSELQSRFDLVCRLLLE